MTDYYEHCNSKLINVIYGKNQKVLENSLAPLKVYKIHWIPVIGSEKHKRKRGKKER